MQLNGKYTTNPSEHEFQLPLLYAAFQLEQLEIDTQQEKLLFVELFTIDAKVRFMQTRIHVHTQTSTYRFLFIFRSLVVGAKSAKCLF